MLLKVEGSFPKGLVPTSIKVEDEKGTFGLYKGVTCLAIGQLYPHVEKKGKKNARVTKAH